MIDRGEGRIIDVNWRPESRNSNPTRADAQSFLGDAKFGSAGQSLGTSQLAYGTSKAALNRFTVGLADEMRGRGVAVNSIDVAAATQPFRYNLPNADLSQNELEEAPAQLVTWLAGQPINMTGNLFDQTELLADLAAKASSDQRLYRPGSRPPGQRCSGSVGSAGDSDV